MLLALLTVAAAQQGPPPPLQVQAEAGLYVMMRSPPKNGPPIARLQAELPLEIRLYDNGQGADKSAGDGIWTGVFVGNFHGLHAFSDSGDNLMWKDELPLKPGGSSLVTVVPEGEGFTGVLEPIGGGGGAPPPDGVAAAVTPATPEAKAGATDAPAASSGGTSDALALAGAAGAGVLGITLGFVGGGLLRRRSRLPVSPVARVEAVELPALGAIGGRARCWSVPDAAARADAAAALAEGLARLGPVILLPGPDSRERFQARLKNTAGVYWLRFDRPDPESVLSAAAALAPLGPPQIVIDGVDAMEAPVKQEAADQVVWELLEGREGAWGAVLLEEAGRLSKLQPDAALERDGAGLTCGGEAAFAAAGDRLVLQGVGA